MNEEAEEIKNPANDDLKDHYDFDYTRAKPNRFADQLAQDRLMVVVERDIAAILPTSGAGNEVAKHFKQSKT